MKRFVVLAALLALAGCGAEKDPTPAAAPPELRTGVVEMREPVDMRVATAAALRHGVWLRPFRNLVYAMPPYICTPAEIAQITAAMVGVARALT